MGDSEDDDSLSKFNQSNSANFGGRSPPKPNPSNCRYCKTPDTDSMIECMVCKSKFHRHCVQTTAPNTWTCRNCRKLKASQTSEVEAANKASDPLTQPIVSTPAEPPAISKDSLKESHTGDKVLALGPISISSKSSARRKRLSLARLEAEREMQEKRDEAYRRLQEQRDQEYLDRKLEIELAEDSDDEKAPSVFSNRENVDSWVKEQRQRVSFFDAPLGEQKPTSGTTTTVHPDLTTTSYRHKSTPWLNPKNQNEFMNSTRIQPAYNEPDVNDPSLTLRQVAVRQVVSKELPIFDGDPVDWPMFISSYVRSTNACNFSDEENLSRLQRCLRGKALDAVRSKLIFPEMVPKVLNTLRMLFGRPQQVIQLMIEQLRREPSINPEKLESVVALSMSVQHLCAIMEATEMEDHLNNPLLLQELVDKLPGMLKLNWATHSMGCQRHNLSTFNDWLYELADAAGSVVKFEVAPTKSNKTEQKSRHVDNSGGFLHAAHHQESGLRYSKTTQPSSDHANNCAICSDVTHRVPDCKNFIDFNVKDRWDAMKTNRLCRKCLGRHHVTKCRVYKDCAVNGCTFKHHPLLHDFEVHTRPSTSSNTKTVGTTSSASPFTTRTKRLLFRVLPVVLYGKNKSVATYAFLDEGSSVTLLDDDIARILELEGPSQDLNLKWTSGTTRKEKNSRQVSLEISATDRIDTKFALNDVFTVESLDLPVQSLTIDNENTAYKHLRGIPFQQYENAKPRILIGLQHWKLGAPLQIREGDFGQPIAADTRLGWTVFGSINHIVSDIENYGFSNFHIRQEQTDVDLHQQVKEFFTTENFGVRCPTTVLRPKEEQRAVEILERTTKQVGNKYVTGLVWKYDEINLPNSLPLAMQRLVSLERKMAKDQNLSQNLKAQIEDYVEKGYAGKLSQDEAKIVTPRTWYLPIFPVINPNKPGKTRIVWDAAAEVNGTSLNSVLLTGPDLLSPLADILLRFREKPIALTGDIREMFHQVGIVEPDQQSQRFLFRCGDRSLPPDTYVMTVMTFGATCSPTCAQYVKNINASKYKSSNPRACYAITHNHYVDDWLDSFNSEDEAIAIAREVMNIHASGGFEIRKFISNSRRVQTELGGDEPGAKNLYASGDHSEQIESSKVLGMWWSTTDDSFYYHVNMDRIPNDVINGTRNPTKREVLRITMTVFDPLGLISSFIVYAKMLLRDIWQSGTTWDEPINDHLCVRLQKWVSLLPELRNIRIPRCYCIQECHSVELHIFVDASENAFAAAAYFRFKYTAGIVCRLATAKTKVAPQKPMTIPRLELQAAVLGARLAKSLPQAQSFQPTRTIMWSDSIDVLFWIHSDNKRFRSFIMFRVGEILNTTERSDWRWVPTKMNVADQATKWKDKPELATTSEWFTGPEFLAFPEDQWPTSDRVELTPDSSEELKPILIHTPITETNIVPDLINIRKWRVLVRSTAIALRFFSIMDIHPSRRNIPVTVEETRRAEGEIYRMVQNQAFPTVIACLKDDPNKPIEKSSYLYKLTPFIDDDGVLRVKGRANRIERPLYDVVNPIVLPYDHTITKMIVDHYHRKYHHFHHEIAINEIRQKYVISSLRTVLQKVRSDCQWCAILRAKPTPPQMGDHPFARVASHLAPFSYVGIDYFGPLEVVVGRHVEKRWVALFTCLTVRAVHLEIVHTLSKKSCLMALRNFISRRGMPLEVRTDNGTNFRGASNELIALHKFRTEMEIAYREEYDEIKWLFNPPSAPHMGGCWERMVRSVKKCITAAMPTRRPNDETLRCFLMEAEAIVNSRPLTYVPIDPELEESITPNHFLIGSSGGIKPFTAFDCDVETLSRNFELSQKMADYFWTKWLREYLPVLTRTTRWFEKVKNIEKGDLVIIMDERERNSWKRGVVIDTVTGGRRDQVRRVIVRTAVGVYERPASKVAVLDVAQKK